MLKDAKFTSVWDGNDEITTNCKVNLETHEIVEIETVDAPQVDILIREYVIIDGEEFPAVRKDDLVGYNKENVFWY